MAVSFGAMQNTGINMIGKYKFGKCLKIISDHIHKF